ncbi:hypothetical protein QFC21_002885 [Naganishia friedmannii]|uniref:Uncharacterized protein n=1 Tax=Naganishia friedmannii TaxID=89922 RepID=A0ACC2VTR3_9TREE|nr:hypothetical protein QFC21_002885 [Naganishia friedmannii]
MALTILLYKALPALAKAFEVLEKMINHLHFLPLTTTLLAITSRLFVITIDVSAYVIQYRAATQELSTVDQSGARTLQPGNPKEKNRDHALLQLEDVVGMMVSGRLPSDRISTAQQQLEAKLSSLKESSVNAETRTLHSNSKSLAESKATMMEMDGEDFGEAIVLPRPATSSHIVSAIRVPPMPIVPVVLDPPSSPDETNVAPLPSRKSISKSRKMPRIPSESDKSHDPLQISSIAVFDLTKPVGEEAPPIPPHPSQKIMAKKRLADSETASTTKPTKRAISAADVEDTSGATVKVKKKKTKKGQDLMDDIFGL